MLNNTPTMSHCQVLIVGAGPTGLTLATALAKYGVQVWIIERKPQLSRHTKATNVMQRNQEVLYALGRLNALNARSGFARRLIVDGYGQTFGPRTMHLNETPYHDIILCGQHNFEAVMAEGLQEAGLTIEFDTELQTLTQTADHVCATLQAPASTETLYCDYVIGCDGAAGVTRTFTKHDFLLKKTGVAIRQADCKLTWRRISSMDQLWLFYFDHGFASIIPLPGGMHRILTIEPKQNIPERNPTLEELQAKLRTITHDDSVTLTEPDWFSYTDLSMGIGTGLRDGRIILAGDVGNPILPNGGQGMNTGISDSFNLGWKLASVLKDGASDALLDSYEHERHQLRAELQNVQYQSLKYTTLVTPRWIQTVIRRLANPLLNWGGEYKIAQAFSELGINTRKSALTLEMIGKRGVRAGDRVLDADVSLDSRTVRLYELLYAGGWTLLAFAGTGADRTQAVADALSSFARTDLPRYIVSTHSRAVPGTPILYDLDEIAHRAYGVVKPMVYLVRPDGYVGARVRLGDMARLNAYVAQWLPRGSLKFDVPPVSVIPETEHATVVQQ